MERVGIEIRVLAKLSYLAGWLEGIERREGVLNVWIYNEDRTHIFKVKR
jgi:hypothetical protein